MKYVIFDLDGCLSDDRWRRNLLPTHDDVVCHDFDEYHERGYSDPHINKDVLEAQISLGVAIVYVTARPERFRQQTASWLHAHFGQRDFELLMRPNDDLRSSPELKVFLIERHGIAWKEIHAAFDDREDVLTAYAQKGVTSVQLLTPPTELASVIANRQPRHTAEEIPGQQGVLDIFQEMATTFEGRNAVYKSNHKVVPEMLKAIFPEGVPPEIAHSEIFPMLVLILVKITRFTTTGMTHVDSIHDIAVYAAMIEANLTGRD